MSEKQDHYTRPVIPLLMCFVSGIVLGEAFPVNAPVCLWAMVLCFFLVVLAIFRGSSPRFSPLALFVLLGMLSITALAGPDHGPGNISYYAEKGLCLVRGRVDSLPETDQGRQTFMLEVRSVQPKNEDPREVSGKLRVTWDSKEEPLNKGTLVELDGRIKTFRNFYNPDGFDYERYMAFQGIVARTYVKKEKLSCLEGSQGPYMDRTRRDFSALIDANAGSDQTASVLKALLIGQRGQMDPALTEAFSRTGTSHLLAISGLHVGIVAGVAYGFLVYVLSFIPALLWQARVRTYAGFLALIPVLGYGFLAGMAPSTQRAVVMVAVVLLAHGLEAEHDIMNSLALAALVILALSPGDLFGVSFQLSFAAVFFIVWGMGCVSRKAGDDEPGRGGVVSWWKSYAWVSVFAYLGTLPLVLYYFNQLSLIGLPANLVMVPLVGFAVVPLGLFGLFCYPLSSVVAGLLIKLSGLVLKVALSGVQWVAGLGFASVKTVRPDIPMIMGYYVLLTLIIYGFSNRVGLTAKTKKAMVWAMVPMAAVIFADTGYWVFHRYFHKDLRVTVLDVGQGSANLVEFPGGSCMMIDGGGFGGISTFDVGEKVVAPFLWSRKIARVDTVVLTHPESDHLNGLLYILENFHVRELWHSGQWRTTPNCVRLREIVAEKGITVKTVEQLADIPNRGGAQISVLWPPSGHGGHADEDRDYNDLSLVVKINMGHQAFLFTGDIMERTESRLVDTLGSGLESNVLIVPHHGSKTSSTERFIDAVKPEYALISAGYGNWFKMPHKAVLKRFDKHGVTVYRTDLQGAILLKSSGKTLDVSTVLSERTRPQTGWCPPTVMPE